MITWKMSSLSQLILPLKIKVLRRLREKRGEMQSDKNANQNEGSFPVVSFARKKKKKESIKSARRLFLAAWGLCQGTDFSLSSQFFPGPFLVCSPFFFLPFFFLSLFN